jgi:hypothetical protein
MSEINQSTKTCSHCGRTQETGESWWPDVDLDIQEDTLCQMCWEAQCDASWWEYWNAWNRELLAGIT